MSDIDNSTGGVGYIYVLVSKYDTSLVYTEQYIGSTKMSLSERLRLHKNDYRRYLNGKCNYMTSFDLFKKYGIDGIDVKPIESYKYDDLKDLRRREGYYIQACECINKVVAGRSKKEYNQINREAINSKNKQYQLDNYERIKEHRRKHYEINRDLIKENYYANRDTINAKITCECGCIVIKRALSTHQKSAKHINLMKSKQ